MQTSAAPAPLIPTSAEKLKAKLQGTLFENNKSYRAQVDQKADPNKPALIINDETQEQYLLGHINALLVKAGYPAAEIKDTRLVIPCDAIPKLLNQFQTPEDTISQKADFFKFRAKHFRDLLLKGQCKKVGIWGNNIMEFNKLLEKIEFFQLKPDEIKQILIKVFPLFTNINSWDFRHVKNPVACEVFYEYERFKRENTDAKGLEAKVFAMPDEKSNDHEALIATLNKFRPPHMKFSPDLMIKKVSNQKPGECDIELTVFSKKDSSKNESDEAKEILTAANCFNKVENLTDNYKNLNTTIKRDAIYTYTYKIKHQDVKAILTSLQTRDERSFAALHDLQMQKLKEAERLQFEKEKNSFAQELQQNESFYRNLFNAANKAVADYTNDGASISYDAYLKTLAEAQDQHSLANCKKILERFKLLYGTEVRKAMEAAEAIKAFQNIYQPAPIPATPALTAAAKH